MNVEFVSYQDKYLDGIADCLRRNFDGMSDKDREYLKHWISPIIYYPWRKDRRLKDLPYLQGLVVLYGDQVVGYFGMIYSIRYWKSRAFLCANPSTWMLDEPYRLYMFRAIKVLFQEADVVLDFTPRKSVAEVLEKVFKFQYYERECVRLYPVPYLYEENIDIKFLSEDTEELDELLQTEYLDHSFSRRVRAVSYRKGEERGVLIYKVMREEGNWIRILKVTNEELLAKNAHEITWKLVRHECYGECVDITQALCQVMELMQEKKKVCVECDRQFFGGKEISHPLYKVADVRRMILNKTDLVIDKPDMLYSELAVLL